jgi:hypothetical protein
MKKRHKIFSLSLSSSSLPLSLLLLSLFLWVLAARKPIRVCNRKRALLISELNYKNTIDLVV